MLLRYIIIVYAANAPEVLPSHELVLGIVKKGLKLSTKIGRVMLVLLAWLFFVPLGALKFTYILQCFTWRSEMKQTYTHFAAN